MLELNGNNWDVLVPNHDEWLRLAIGEFTEIRGIPVVHQKYMGMRSTVKERAYHTKTVLTVLCTRFSFRPEWSPLMFLWPEGVPTELLSKGDTRHLDDAIRVYFHRFFCPDCRLRLWGYAVSPDAYRPGELQPAMRRIKGFKRCPRCGGGMRHPALVEILRVCAEDEP